MTRNEAVDILIKYAEKDEANDSLQKAIIFLKQEKNKQTPDNIIVSNFPKYFDVAVQQTQTIHYKVLHDSLEEAVKQVQKKVNERDWKQLLYFPPGSPQHRPIPPFTEYEIKDVTVKEIVLRPNPHSEGGSSDT
jgi:mRNA deadenylase 3'-5' endonuclease subunit Ccr4